jgi:hypothetical protein
MVSMNSNLQLATPAIDLEGAWQQLLARDPAAAFFTRSRRLEFFAAQAAEVDGRFAPMFASSTRQPRRRRPVFAPASAAGLTLQRAALSKESVPTSRLISTTQSRWLNWDA